MGEQQEREWTVESVLFAYSKKKAHYNAFEKIIKEYLCKILENAKIECTVLGRVKENSSVERKLYEKGDQYKDPLVDIWDYCGLRIIVRYLRDIAKVNEIVRDNFSVCGVEDKKEKMNASEFGYVDYQFHVKISEEMASDIEKWTSYEDFGFEIQVRTALQDAWAIVSHHVAYKNKNINREYKRRLAGLAAMLELLDDAFSTIVSEIEELTSEEYFAEEIGNICIDEKSLVEYLDTSSIYKTIQEAIAKKSMRIVSKRRPEYIRIMVEILKQIGIVTPYDLDKWLNEHVDRLEKIMYEWLAIAKIESYNEDAFFVYMILFMSGDSKLIQQHAARWENPFKQILLDVSGKLPWYS